MPYSMPLCTILTKCRHRLDRNAGIRVRQCRYLLPAWRAGRRVDARSQREKIGSMRWTTDSSPRSSGSSHARLPRSAARAGIHIMDAFGLQLRGAANVIVVVGVTAIDDHVILFEKGINSSSMESTTAAGTIIQTARGAFSFLARSSSEAAPTAPSLASFSTGPYADRRPRSDGQPSSGASPY